MTGSATGLVLRARPLTETSLVLHWLTPEFGRMATVAKGARRPQSPFFGKVDLFYLADLSFHRSRRSDLHTLREVGLRETHPALRQNMDRLRLAAYATAFIEQATETETPLPDVYELLRDFLACLCRQPASPQLLLAFEHKLLRELGLDPGQAETGLAAGTKKIAGILAEKEWETGLRLKLTGAQTTELGRFLQGFLGIHLNRVPKGRAAALAGAMDADSPAR